MKVKTKKRLKTDAREVMQGLYKAGGIKISTLKEFEAAYFSEVKELSSSKIQKIRRAAGISQPVLAKIMNVSAAAIKQWERGERKPSGAALKLLNLIESKGLDAVL